MNTQSQPSNTIIYIVFLLAVILLTAISTFAQSSKTSNDLVVPVLIPDADPSTYHIVDLPEKFDYNNLRIEIFGTEGEIKHCFVSYSISERSFVIDLTNFTNGTYNIHVINGKTTYFDTMKVNK